MAGAKERTDIGFGRGNDENGWKFPCALVVGRMSILAITFQSVALGTQLQFVHELAAVNRSLYLYKRITGLYGIVFR